MQRHNHAIIFGKTNLAIKCIEHLLSKHWIIESVVTEDNDVKYWCYDKQIKVLTAFNSSQNLTNCYLFSIVNPNVISSKVLAEINPIKAINYHDSLLPKYAGVNSTTWAIINNEQFHGITWHEIINKIDGGEVYYQAKLSIDATETALSLNLKCVQAALVGFIDVVNKIEKNTLMGNKQDVSLRTYYGLKHIPDNYAYLTVNDSIDYINSLFNSLNFGINYINPVSTVKIKINGISCILEKRVPENNISKVNSTSCVVKNIYGKQVNWEFNLDKSASYFLENKDIIWFQQFKQKETLIYRKIISIIDNFEPNSSLFIKSSTISTYEKLTVHYNISISDLCTSLYIILSRLNSNQTFLKVYHNIDYKLQIVKDITEHISLICLNHENLTLPYNDLQQKIITVLDHDKFHITKDFGYRYNLDLCSDFAIIDNYHGEVDEHRVIFVVDDDKVIVRFCQEDIEFIEILMKTLNLLFEDSNKEQYLNVKIKDIPLLPKDDYIKVVNTWNDTDRYYSEDKTVHQLFEEQVEKTPNNIAISFKRVRLTYKELNEKSNQLANYLGVKYSIQLDDLITLHLDRNEYMVIAILAILKSGAAYVPIDSMCPDDRIEYIIKDAKAKLILTNKIYKNKISNILLRLNKNSNCIEIIDNKLINNFNLEKFNNANFYSAVSKNNLAYVIYTSGTTGNPNGVMVEHISVVNYLFNIKEAIFKNVKRNVDFSTSIGFDLSVTNILGAICFGHELHIYGGNILNFEGYKGYLIDNKIDIVKFVPSFFELFSDHMVGTNITTIILGGEKLSESFLDRINYEIKIYNEYGPTETTVGCCLSCIYNNGKKINPGNIGKPYYNYSCYILDKNQCLLPVGSIGELYIGGVGLSRGYLNRSKLTAEKFIINPFQIKDKIHKKYNKLYKTGDLARYLSNGSIEYIGRNDFQIKIRGHRVEPGEIECVLCSYPEIKQAVVMMDKTVLSKGLINNYLVGYYVANTKLDEQNILTYLQDKLPDYMIPNRLIWMKKFPLTLNAKLNRQELAKIKDNDLDSYTQPQDNLQKKITYIWSEILGVPFTKISITSNFFKLGGNSLSAIKLCEELTKIPQFKHLNTVDIFKHDTIEKLIKSLNKNNVEIIQNFHNGSQNHHEIAIIGMSGAFSGCHDEDSFWKLINEKKEGLKRYSIQECRELKVSEDLLQNPNFVPVSGQVPEIDLFDPAFWEMSVNEAKQTDPHIRKMLEHAWYALEDSGYIKERHNLNIGVFVGGGNNTYLVEHILHGTSSENINYWEADTLTNKDAIATKISYFLGLIGPAKSINTACSTGLVTIIEACQNLYLGTCDVALSGSVSFIMPDNPGYLYQDDMILSKNGHCRTFDKSADGTVMGSGTGILVLKRLDDAIRDGDDILAVIKGYAINNDGNRKATYTAPSIIGQKECILNAQKMANITSTEIDFIECHGTGTNLGDAVEIQALNEVFTSNTLKYVEESDKKCILGSVKTNIGHADSAAGIAGVIKLCNMLKHNIIPGQINFVEANPELHLEKTSFKIIKSNKKWSKNNLTPRIAGISSFGIGGTNAHIIIGDHVQLSIHPFDLENVITEVQESYVLPISAKSSRSLEKYKQEFLRFLETSSATIRDIAYTLQQKRENFAYRLAVVAKNKEDAIQKICQNQQISKNIFEFNQVQKIVFMFPGQGTQHPDMYVDLYQNDSYFRQVVDECTNIINQQIKVDFAKILYPKIYGNINEDINQTKWAQIALFTISYALAKVLIRLNILPNSYIGHSLGEYVAATLSGVFSLEDALYVLINRGFLMQEMPCGHMLSIQANVDYVKSLISSNDCEIAVINAQNNCVASGAITNIKKLKHELETREIPSIILNTSHAYHSKMMNGATEKFVQVIKNVKLNNPKEQFISNITGEFITTAQATSPEYWANHIRHRVEFAHGINTLHNYYQDNVIFIEVGIGNVLSSFIQQRHKPVRTIQLGNYKNEFKYPKQTHDDVSDIKDILQTLWVNGLTVDIAKHHDFKYAKRIKLPKYQFDHQVCWIKKDISENFKRELSLLPREKWCSSPIWKKLFNISRETNNFSVKKQKILLFVNPEFNWNTEILNNFDVLTITLDNTLKVDYCFDDKKKLKLNPTVENAYTELLKYLQKNKFDVEIIIHCATLHSRLLKKQLESINLDYSCYSIFLIRYLLINSLKKLQKLVLLTNGLSQITGSDVIVPDNGTMVGAIRNIKRELPFIQSMIIDIGFDNTSVLPYLFKILFGKDNNLYNSNYLYAIRFNSLWVEEFEKSKLQLTEPVVKDNDVVLITGGLGGVGLSIAKKITEKHNNITFILVSRNNIYDIQNPSESVKNKLSILNWIKKRNCRFDIQCLDITDEVEVEKLIQYIYNKYSVINGIIHTAGIMPTTKNNYAIKEISEVMQAKVLGINFVLKAINKKNLRYVAMTSSLASIMGDINRIAYCAANSYLDYLAVALCDFSDTKFISVNWPIWLDTGMTLNQQENKLQSIDIHHFKKTIELNAISSEEGAQLLYDLINQEQYNQIVISKFDLRVLNDRLSNFRNLEFSQKKIKIKELYCTDLENTIAQIFCDILGIEEISLHDNFFSLGGNSLIAIKLISMLKNINMSVNIDDIVANSSTAKLSNFISSGNNSYSIVVPLKLNHKAKKNIFFIHAVGGTITGYIDFANRLSDAYNYYGIQNINIHGIQLLKADSLIELAKIYLREILRIQSDGEFIFIGLSMGGTISFEISRQLLQLKRKVKAVYMIDTWATFSDEFRNEEIFRSHMREQESYVETLKEIDDDTKQSLTTARWNLMQLLTTYIPQNASIPIILLKAAQLDKMHSTNLNSEDNGWNLYTNHSVEVHIIPGDHITVNFEPGLSEMVDIINKHLVI